MEEEPPRRPMRPYSIYKKEKEDKNESPAKIIKSWRMLSEEEKKPYVHKERLLRMKFDKYRLSLGIPPTSFEKPTEFSVTETKRLCNTNMITKPMDTSLYKALARVTEELIKKIGKELSKRANKKEASVTFDQAKEVIENLKEFEFLKKMPAYEIIVKGINKALNEEN